MTVGTLVGLHGLVAIADGEIGEQERRWFYGIVIAPLVPNKTTIKWNSGLTRTYSTWELRDLKVLS